MVLISTSKLAKSFDMKEDGENNRKITNSTFCIKSKNFNQKSAIS